MKPRKIKTDIYWVGAVDWEEAEKGHQEAVNLFKPEFSYKLLFFTYIPISIKVVYLRAKLRIKKILTYIRVRFKSLNHDSPKK